jgi:hypothetical protein
MSERPSSKRPETVLEIQEAEIALEQAASLALGRMLMAFSRMEMELGLALVWVNDGKELETRTAKLDQSNFHVKLEELRKHLDQRGCSDEVGKKLSAWMEKAHGLRGIRNELVHGRWGIAAVQGVVVNVIGLPTSPEQRPTSYRIADLDRIVDDIHRLRAELSKLRNRWPVRRR